MELPSGIVKADNPMVAERRDIRLQNAKRSTTKKWDLSSQDDFLAWNPADSLSEERRWQEDLLHLQDVVAGCQGRRLCGPPVARLDPHEE
eukprot:1211754-Prymnesium_polylepis.1